MYKLLSAIFPKSASNDRTNNWRTSTPNVTPNVTTNRNSPININICHVYDCNILDTYKKLILVFITLIFVCASQSRAALSCYELFYKVPVQPNYISKQCTLELFREELEGKLSRVTENDLTPSTPDSTLFKLGLTLRQRLISAHEYMSKAKIRVKYLGSRWQYGEHNVLIETPVFAVEVNYENEATRYFAFRTFLWSKNTKMDSLQLNETMSPAILSDAYTARGLMERPLFKVVEWQNKSFEFDEIQVNTLVLDSKEMPFINVRFLKDNKQTTRENYSLPLIKIESGGVYLFSGVVNNKHIEIRWQSRNQTLILSLTPFTTNSYSGLEFTPNQVQYIFLRAIESIH